MARIEALSWPSLIVLWISSRHRQHPNMRTAEQYSTTLAAGWKPWDFVEPYLRQILGFIGIDDVQSIRVEGMNIPALAPDAVAKANGQIEGLVL
jgi:hypothetical protein